ncbi:MAG: AIR synthase family protein [Candidatus Bipolaricaulota bacterium]|nr:AIR synthase family protein [Candidatus Bipolaricaulota bacterium]MDW8031299.1 AIR synthase family protein [Candidatus Bipolaricaulota bacterium]
MAEFPTLGKIDKKFFDEVIYPRLGAARPEVLVGPRHGADTAIVRLDQGQVLVATTDPVSVIPALGLEDSAWLSVHLLASDLVTSGLPPAYAILTFNLPPHMPARDFEIYWHAMHREFAKLGIAVIGGHTGRYMGCDYTIIGAGTLIAVGPEDHYVSGQMAQPGDSLILTKGAAIATTGLLSRVFPETIRSRFGEAFLARAQAFFSRFSVVEDALTAVSVGVREAGVTAMHDATEGGVLGALYEFSSAARCGLRVDLAKIPIAEETRQICELFEIDPYSSLSEGTLLISARPAKAHAVVATLQAKGIAASIIGEITPPEEGCKLISDDGIRELEPPREDPYWKAFWRAVDQGWR